MANNEELSVKQILDKFYGKDSDLLKHALIAKTEEDKKQIAEVFLEIEKAKIYSKQLNIELMKEQSKLSTSVHRLAVPMSPVVQYPHSAHPLCTDSSNNRIHQYPRFRHYQYSQLATPISPILESPSAATKRNHSMIESGANRSDYHNKVMQALREKIIGGNPNLMENKRRRTLPKIITHDIDKHSIKSDSPSPALTTNLKLPPIDTRSNMIPPLNPPLSPINTSSSSSPSL